MKRNKIKAIICAVICVASVMGTTVNAENYHVTPTPDYIDDGGISARDTEKPNKVWNLYSNGRYDFSGSSSNGRNVYTSYNFTGVSQISLHVENSLDQDLTVKVYKNVAWWPDVLVDTFTVPGNSSKTFDRGTWSADENYYIVFVADCKFSGYIERLQW